MKFTDKDAIWVRNSFNKHFLELLDLTNPVQVNQHVDILSKLLLIIKKTHRKSNPDIFSNEALTGVLNFVTVRKIERETDFDMIIEKYDKSLKDVKRLYSIFHTTENSIHDIINTLHDYIDGYSNTFSRSILFINLQGIASTETKEIEKFFYPIMNNEMLLYGGADFKKITKESVETVVEQSYSAMFNVLTKFCFDKEKQYVNIQKVLKESSFLIQTMVS